MVDRKGSKPLYLALYDGAVVDRAQAEESHPLAKTEIGRLLQLNRLKEDGGTIYFNKPADQIGIVPPIGPKPIR